MDRNQSLGDMALGKIRIDLQSPRRCLPGGAIRILGRVRPANPPVDSISIGQGGMGLREFGLLGDRLLEELYLSPDSRVQSLQVKLYGFRRDGTEAFETR